MLDVYRTFYQLTGEPFRLGPDHRFSLHHPSYANAKAYLDFAIYQGEGFIAITGGPGTGKTTLISEILAGLDREKIEVATLTSTQLESRDLLHMVASSFGLHPEQVSKSDLLLEIENFLVTRIRNGHRAILIVDEAQGLSPGALEELRLLANLQYQYQLLLQIVLVGQERLLELIRSPGMEHLQQRLVAATSLEPLSFDETIDYIEHRLSRVGWKGDPAIDESALRLVYRYSGGIPRRINLIANRLFLYGGMEEKHSFNGEDARSVIDGLIEEFLLPPEPALAEDAVKETPAAPGQKRKARSLPRDTGGSGKAARPAAPDQPAESGGSSAPADKPTQAAEEPTERRETAPQPRTRQRPPADFKLDRDSMPGSRAESRLTRGRAQKGRSAGPGHKPRRPSGTHRAPEPAPRHDQPSESQFLDDDEDTDAGSKGLLVFVLLLAGAGATYFLYDKSIDLDRLYKAVRDTTGVEVRAPQESQAPELADQGIPLTESVPEAPDSADAAPPQARDAAGDGAEEIKLADKGQIIRAPDSEPPGEAGAAAAPESDTTPAAGQGVPAPGPAETAVEAPRDDTVQPAQPPAALTDKTLAGESAAVPTPPAKAGDDVGIRALSDSPGPTAVAARTAPAEAADSEQQRAALQAEVEAEQAQVERARPTAAPPKPLPPKVEAKPAAPAVAPVASNTVPEPAAPPIDAERARLKEAAEQRFSEQVARIQFAGEAAPLATASTAARPAAAARPTPPPDIALIEAEPPAAAPPPEKKLPITPTDIKTTLLQGRWSSSGKPATLLPSESTFCDNRGDRIWCVSVPQNVKTQYGLALYKVETTLTGFAAVGQFEMSYRTMVKLVGEEGDWQVTDYSMTCTLTDSNQVSCLDDKGVTRRYVRSGPGRS